MNEMRRPTGNVSPRGARFREGGSRAVAGAAALAVALLCSGAAVRAANAPEEPPAPLERTPPRLALVDGAVSLHRADDDGWVPAPVNLPLAPGDELYTDNDASVELQVGPRAYLRASGETQIGVTTQEPDFLQVRIASGTASLDLRSARGATYELDTPYGAFTIDDVGYYRVDVESDSTRFVVRHGGRATLAPVNGAAEEIASSEEVVLDGDPDGPSIESYAADALDSFDTWCYRRTNHLLDSQSARYVAADVYGLDALDHDGNWRTFPEYGPVWFPVGVVGDWAPYTTGRWIFDPGYGWTWVDDAPWGWAPFHYGRWVFVGGYWGWAPGPVVVRSVYSPALVAFFGTPSVSVRAVFGAPRVAWVALGWGEPIVPWWGTPVFRERAYWRGWGGPHIVNRAAVERHAVVLASDVRTYANPRERGAWVEVAARDFARRDVRESTVKRAEPGKLELLRDAPHGEHGAGLAAGGRKGVAPPAAVLERRVVATRREPAPEEGRHHAVTPIPRTVPAPNRIEQQAEPVPRPRFGGRVGEERRAPTAPPRLPDVRREQGGEPTGAAPAPRAGRPAPPPPPTAAPPPHDFPGEPANRVFRGRAIAPPPQALPRPEPPHGGREGPRERRSRGEGQQPGH